MRHGGEDIPVRNKFTPSGYAQSRKSVPTALACGYALSPDSQVTRGRRAPRRRRSDYKPVLLQCGIISQDEFDGLMGMELLKFGEARRKVSKTREVNAGHELSVLLRKIVNGAASVGEQPSAVFVLSELAGQLGVSLQRLGAVFTVLEALQVVDRGLERGTYRWRGIEHFRGGSELFSPHGVGGGTLKDVGLPPNHNDTNATDLSLWGLARVFLRCLLSQQIISIPDAVEQVHSLHGNSTAIDKKNLEVQLMDIAGILVELGLVKSLTSSKRTHPAAYRWVGVGKPRRTLRVAASRQSVTREGDNSSSGSTHKLLWRRDSMPFQDRAALADGVHPSTSDNPKPAVDPRFNHSTAEPPCTTSRPFQSHSTVASGQSFGHYPVPLNVLNGTTVLQLNNSSSIPIGHQPEASVRPLNTAYGDQFFGLMPLPANRLDGNVGGLGQIEPSLPLRGQMNFGHNPGRPAESVFTPVMAYTLGDGTQVIGNSGKHIALPQGKGNNSRVSLLGHTISEVDLSRCEFGTLVNPQRHVNGLVSRAESQMEAPSGNHHQLWVQDPRQDFAFYQPQLPTGSKLVLDNRDGVVRSRQDIFSGCQLEHWPRENGRNNSIQKDLTSLMTFFARGGVTQEGYMGHQTTCPGPMPNAAGNLRQLQ